MSDISISVTIDKKATITREYIGVQNEQMTVGVTVDAGIIALGYEAFVEFLKADGTSYYRGPYDCSSGTFEFTLGIYDTILDKEGKLYWQFVLAETVATVRTAKWKALQYESKVMPAINATTSSGLPSVPLDEWPDLFPATGVTVADPSTHWTGYLLEDILNEIGTRLEALE